MVSASHHQKSNQMLTEKLLERERDVPDGESANAVSQNSVHVSRGLLFFLNLAGWNLVSSVLTSFIFSSLSHLFIVQ